MDTSTVHQFRFLLLLLGAGLAVALLAVGLSRRTPPGAARATGASEDAPASGPWREALALLVGVSALTALVYLFPAGVVFRFFHTWQAVVYLVAFVLVTAAPVVYAARTRVL
jgi:hypothetical protein